MCSFFPSLIRQSVKKGEKQRIFTSDQLGCSRSNLLVLLPFASFCFDDSGFVGVVIVVVAAVVVFVVDAVVV